MIRISPLGIQGDLVPQAIFWRPVQYFAAQNRHEEDDLDTYIAVCFVRGNYIFDLRTYRGHPPHTSTMYIPRDVNKLADIVNLVEVARSDMAVPKQAIAWQRGWDFLFGELRQEPKARLREREARIIALKIAARAQNGYASTQEIKARFPEYLTFSPRDLRRSPTRKNEPVWEQIVRNVISHEKSRVSLFSQELAIRVGDGIRAIQKGLDYLKSIGFLS